MTDQNLVANVKVEVTSQREHLLCQVHCVLDSGYIGANHQEAIDVST